MSTGLIALLDDITAIAKLAAASIDDTISQASKVGSKAVSKAAGIVIDDAAVTPRYVVGLASKRELPIIAKIAFGSIKNKILFLLPAALLLSFFASWLITPLLMIGGTFLCYEGWHKVADLLGLHQVAVEENSAESGLNLEQIETQRIKEAIRTDFILSAEIMAITLSTVADSTVWIQGVVLALSGCIMTFIVYTVVALIVKADDFGAYLALQRNSIIKRIGRIIVFGMPIFLQILSQIGMLAMLWVGGGILVHGLHELGVHQPEYWINEMGASVSLSAGAFIAWISKASIAAIIGVVVGAVVEVLTTKIISPIFFKLKTST